MDAQTLATIIKRHTKRGEWWTWEAMPMPRIDVRNTVPTLLSWGWLVRAELAMNDPNRSGGTRYAYRWTETTVARV